MRRSLALVLVTAIGALLGLMATVATASPASAQGQCGTDLSTNPAAPRLILPGGSDLPAGAANTRVAVNGERYLTGLYQCGANKFGGVYVFFGWVQPGNTWGPANRSSTSSNGQFGITYHYPGEGGGADVRDDPNGVVRLVSFTMGGLSGGETPFHMDGNGNWSAHLIVPGPVYTWKDPATNAVNRVDCRAVQCGVFTIGAHGISSKTNEQFTPIRFVSQPGTPAPAPAASGGGTPGATAPSAGSTATTPRPAGATPTTSGGGTTGANGTATSVAPDPTGATTPIPGAAVVADPAIVDPDATTTTAALDTSSSDRADAAVASRGASSAKALAFTDRASGTEATDGGGSSVVRIAGIVLVAALGAAAIAVTIRRRRSPTGASST